MSKEIKNISTERQCLNCDSLIQEEFNYCPECGQRTNDKLTLGILFNNFIHNYFSVDARFFRSFVPLLFKPGYLAKKYIDGRRLRYLHPVQLYLFISVVFFFLFSIGKKEKQENFDASLSQGIENSIMKDSLSAMGIDPDSSPVVEDSVDNVNLSFDFNSRKLDSLIKINASEKEKLAVIGLKENTRFIGKYFYSQVLKIYEQRGKGILGVFYDSIPIAVFFLLPLFALFLKLLFFKKGPYSYHLVYSFYYFSFIYLVFSIFVVGSFIGPLPNWLFFILFLVLSSYLYIGIFKFYNVKWARALFRSLVLLFVNTLFLIPLAFIVIFIMTLLFY